MTGDPGIVMMPHIEVADVSLTYDTPSGQVPGVDGVSIDIEASEFLCIVGPSGCGKSTLLNIIAGFLSPTAGEIRIGGKAVTGHGLDRGVVFQDFAQLFPWRTALGNVTFGLEMKGIGKAEREEIALRQLRLVKLEKFVQSYPHHLSGGMQQRVAIARALAYNPSVLLMDEPFAALDALTRDDMQRLLADVWRETRKTVIYVTHNVAEAVYLADRVVVMTPHPGRVKIELPIPLARPRDPLSVEFLEYQKSLLQHLGQRGSRRGRCEELEGCITDNESRIVMTSTVSLMKTGLCGALALLALVGTADAQEPYPARPIRLVVGFGAGGPTDIPARFIADKLGDALGQRVIVENKPAASGMIATRDVLSQPRDGYTLLLCTHFEAINTAAYKNVQFKLSDLAPISLIAKYYYGLALANVIPADTLETFVQYAKAHRGEVTLRHHRRRLGAGDPGAAAGKAHRHHHEPDPVPRRSPGGAGNGRRARRLLRLADAGDRAAIRDQAAQDPGGVGARAAEEPGRHSHPHGEGHRFRALRLARHLRRRRHAAADHQPAAPQSRHHRRHARIPRDDREGGLLRGLVDAGRAATSHHADAGRGRRPAFANSACSRNKHDPEKLQTFRTRPCDQETMIPKSCRLFG